MEVHGSIPSTREVNAGGSRVQGSSQLHELERNPIPETLFQKINKKPPNTQREATKAEHFPVYPWDNREPDLPIVIL